MTEPIKPGPQIDAHQVTWVQEGIPYEYVASVTTHPSAAILRRRNPLTGDTEIIPQDILRCAEASHRIKKLATDGKDLYLLFDDSSITEQIGKVFKVDGKWRIQFAWLNPNWRSRIKIENLILKGERIYASVASDDPCKALQLFDLAGFEAGPRDMPCHLYIYSK